jgi:hypothetical protein
MMMTWNKWKSLILLAIIGISGVGLQIKTMAQPPEPPAPVYHQLPPYYTGDKVPGDPANEVKIMKTLYRYIQIYRKRHDGNYPPKSTNTDPFLDDIIHNPVDYGFADYKTSKNKNAFEEFFKTYDDSLVNQDNQYSDDNFMRENPNHIKILSTSINHEWPDGKPLGSPKAPGTRDVLATCSLYYHLNSAYLSKTHTTPNPVGFYMVLWDDGQISKIPYDQVLTSPTVIYPQGGMEGTYVFPGEAGVPWNSLTYNEFYNKTFSGSETPPIGFPLAPGQTEPKPDNGGIESLVILKRLENQSFDREQIWDSLGHQVKDFTLDDIQAGAAKLKFPLEKKTISLDELQKLHTPAILHLNSVWDIVTVPAMDDDFAIVCYQGATLIVPTSKLAELYSGTALVPANVMQPLPLQVDNAVRTVNFNSDLDDVPQKVIITNTGAKSISLTLEQPICGVTKAALSQSQIAAGQSATLDLNFEWRSFLPGNKQSTFVMIRTDNPAQPVLQLGFQLQLNDGK